jgi:UDP-GlcNAc:undecaprenyl-phosphate GlcNAc-1-phosphate transferase
MEQLLLSVILSFAITFYCIPIIIRIAQVKNLYDNPDDVRKLHKVPVPSLGGLGIFLGVFISLTAFSEIWVTSYSFPYYLATFVIILFLGLKDDILVISPWKKLLGQILVALILTFKAGLLIDSMHGFLGFTAVHSTLSYPLTLFTIIVIINAFNLIDGVDGLAGSIGLIAAAAFGFYFLIDGQLSYALLAFTLCASLFAFLIFNFQPAKIFMGDGGSMLTGLIIAILSIQFISSAPFSKVHAIGASPVLGFGFILLPMMDTLRVFSFRMLKGRSPFSPDRNHIHHLLLDRGFTHRTVTLFSALIGVVSIFLSYYLAFSFNCTIGIIALIVLFYLYVGILYLTRKSQGNNALKVVQTEEERA